MEWCAYAEYSLATFLGRDLRPLCLPYADVQLSPQELLDGLVILDM
jgi:hypothetical protein